MDTGIDCSMNGSYLLFSPPHFAKQAKSKTEMSGSLIRHLGQDFVFLPSCGPAEQPALGHLLWETSWKKHSTSLEWPRQFTGNLLKPGEVQKGSELDDKPDCILLPGSNYRTRAARPGRQVREGRDLLSDFFLLLRVIYTPQTSCKTIRKGKTWNKNWP